MRRRSTPSCSWQARGSPTSWSWWPTAPSRHRRPCGAGSRHGPARIGSSSSISPRSGWRRPPPWPQPPRRSRRRFAAGRLDRRHWPAATRSSSWSWLDSPDPTNRRRWCRRLPTRSWPGSSISTRPSAAWLRRLAVASDDLDPDTVVALTDASEEEAFELLDVALAAGVLVVDQARYRFRHELVRQALIGQLVPHQRVAIHRDTARQLVEVRGSTRADRPPLARGSAPGGGGRLAARRRPPRRPAGCVR